MKRSTSPLAKLIALTCVLALVLSLIPAAWAAGSNRDSGSTSLPKLSKEEITQLLRENPNTMPDQVFDVTPSVTAPYSIGQVSSQALQPQLPAAHCRTSLRHPGRQSVRECPVRCGAHCRQRRSEPQSQQTRRYGRELL